MKALSRFFAFLLALSLIASVSAYILGMTLWSTDKLSGAAAQANIAEKIAVGIPDVLKNSLGLSSDEAFIIKTVVTKETVDPYIRQIIEKIAHPDASALQIDFKDFRQTIRGESLPLPPKLADLTARPFTILSAPQAAQLSSAKRTDDQVKVFAPAIALILAILILVIARHSRFLVLAEACIMTAVGLGFIGLLLPLLPGLFTSAIGTSPIAPLQSGITEVVRALLNAAQAVYYRAALITVAAALVFFMLHGLVVFRHKFGKKKQHG